LLTKEDDLGHLFVSVAYGTSQKTTRWFRGEFLLSTFQGTLHPSMVRIAAAAYAAIRGAVRV
jgi:hypothetical protein